MIDQVSAAVFAHLKDVVVDAVGPYVAEGIPFSLDRRFTAVLDPELLSRNEIYVNVASR